MKVGNLVASVSRQAGGLFSSVRNLTIYTRAAGADVVCFGLEDKFTGSDLPAWGDLRVKVHPVVGPRRFGFSPGLVRSIQDSGIELLHLHGIWMYPSIASRIACRRGRLPLIISAHGMLDPWALRNSAWKKRIASLFYEAAHLRSASCLRALCESEAASMRALGLRNAICLIPNGQVLPPETQVPEDGHGLAFAPGRKVLLFLSRLHPKKGLPNLLCAWAKSQKTDAPAREWVLVVAGGDEVGHEGLLRRMIIELGVQDSVLLPGPLYNQRKDSTFKRADAFILPSYSEGLPMAVLEAWAWRLPVFMTPQCNLPEGFAEGAAIRVDPNVESLSEGLRALFRMSESERKEMGARGRRLVEQRFSWPRVAEQMVSVYQWVLGDGPKPECVVEP